LLVGWFVRLLTLGHWSGLAVACWRKMFEECVLQIQRVKGGRTNASVMRTPTIIVRRAQVTLSGDSFAFSLLCYITALVFVDAGAQSTLGKTFLPENIGMKN